MRCTRLMSPILESDQLPCTPKHMVILIGLQRLHIFLQDKSYQVRWMERYVCGQHTVEAPAPTCHDNQRILYRKSSQICDMTLPLLAAMMETLRFIRFRRTMDLPHRVRPRQLHDVRWEEAVECLPCVLHPARYCRDTVNLY